MMNKLRLTICGGAGTVTGSNFLLETVSDSQDKSFRVLVDCGLEQGSVEAEKRNYDPFPYDPASIDILLVTHAHADHIGRIPKLVRDGFRGKIISTSPTKDLAELSFDDALSIQVSKLSKQEIPAMLFERSDIEKSLVIWETTSYHQKVDLGQGLSAYFKDAGHILGSSIIEITYQDSTIAFTGDLGNSPAPLLRDTEPVSARYLVMESVYGDRNHESKDGRSEKLKRIITETIGRGGTLLIPAFSIERTQVLLFELNNMIEAREIPSVPVFLDSPLATKVTDIYRKYSNLFNDAAQAQIKAGDDLFSFPRFQITESKEESKSINDVQGSKVILAGSGMSMGGRVIFHEQNYLEDPKNTLLLVGYQVPGSIGRNLLEGVKSLRIFGKKVKVRAQIEELLGYSAHKDSDNLFDFVASAEGIEKVFVVLGETKSRLFLTQRLRDYLDIEAVSPKDGESFELEF